MIIGAHSIIYSKNPEADRAFLRDVLKFPHADAGGGWLIFGLPPAEVAVHPSHENDVHEFYLMTDDVDEMVSAMHARGITCGPIHDHDWGLLTQVTLPGGGKLGVYQPKHARPAAAGKAGVSAARKVAKPASRKKAASKTSRKPAGRSKPARQAKAGARKAKKKTRRG